jgi:hypothetical protein
MKKILLVLFLLAPVAAFAQNASGGDNPFLGEWRVELIGQKDAYHWTVKDDGTIESKSKNAVTTMTYDVDRAKQEITLTGKDSKPLRLGYTVDGHVFVLSLKKIEGSAAFSEYEEAFGSTWDKLKGTNSVTDDAVEHLKKQLDLLLDGLPIMKGFRENIPQ